MLDLKKVNKKIILIGAMLFIALSWTIAYLLCSNSSAYKKAVEFSTNNSSVIETIGNLKSHRLGFYNFRVSWSHKFGSAEFTQVLSGEKLEVDIYFLLVKKEQGGWIVTKAVLKDDNKSVVLIGY